MEKKECTRCKGTGISKGFSGQDYSYPDKPCYSCDGRGYFEAPDYQAILLEIKGRKGLCSKRPKSDRSYFIWRLARFHGGQDVTMPVMAEIAISGDPYEPELNKLAEIVAKRVYGTDMAAAHRWGKAFGYLNKDVDGLPSSAYSSGPVVLDNNKPLEELAELI